MDRMLELAEAAGACRSCSSPKAAAGGPGDTDVPGVAGLDMPTFAQFAKLSGLVPLVGIDSGRCFAGNAALLGCCDVIIATENSNIGMGGPAMIEGGGLGVYRPEEVGPISVQVAERRRRRRWSRTKPRRSRVAQAVPLLLPGRARRSGRPPTSACCAASIPENRLRVYDIRSVIETLADTARVLELRRDFGVGMITALVRIEGRPFGLIANNPMHLGGAIDADGRRQGRALHAALRRVRPADRVAVRHARLHGRPGGREDRAWCATSRACS